MRSGECPFISWSYLGLSLLTIASVWGDHLDALLFESLIKGVRVVCLVSHQPLGLLLQKAASLHTAFTHLKAVEPASASSRASQWQKGSPRNTPSDVQETNAGLECYCHGIEGETHLSVTPQARRLSCHLGLTQDARLSV